jgi:hypothetical protein
MVALDATVRGFAAVGKYIYSSLLIVLMCTSCMGAQEAFEKQENYRERQRIGELVANKQFSEAIPLLEATVAASKTVDGIYLADKYVLAMTYNAIDDKDKSRATLAEIVTIIEGAPDGKSRYTHIYELVQSKLKRLGGDGGSP